MTTPLLTGLETKLGEIGLKTPIPEFAGTRVLERPLDIFRAYLSDIIRDIVQIDPVHAYSAVQLPPAVDGFSGDLTVILPRLAKDAGIDIETLRDSILKQFPQPCPLFQPPIPDGKQLRIFFHSKPLAALVLPFIKDRGTSYASSTVEPESTTPKVVIDFSSPNLVAELSGKHFRSAILGTQLANAYRTQGWDVIKLNYLGDWGKPIGLLGAGFERFGSDDLLKTDTIQHLRHVYKQMLELFAPELASSKKPRDDEKSHEENGDSAEVESTGIDAERNAFFTKLEGGDEAATALWQQFRDACVEHYVTLYGRLNVDFDEYSGESMVKTETMNEVEEALKAKGICEQSEQSLAIDLQQHGSKHGTAKLRDQTGCSTYLLRELAAAIERYEKYKFDKMIYVVAADQTTHFHKLTKILELLDKSELAQKLQHVSFNEASHIPEPSDPEQTLDQTLNQYEEAMQKSLLAHSREAALMGVGANVASHLTAAAWFAEASSVKRAAELRFGVDKITGFEPGTAPYFLSWLARLSCVTGKASQSFNESVDDLEYLEDDDNANLLRWLAHFPEVVQTAFRTLEPMVVMSYIGTVTSILDECFEGEENISATSPGHLEFLDAVRVVLLNALALIGVSEMHGRDSGIYV